MTSNNALSQQRKGWIYIVLFVATYVFLVIIFSQLSQTEILKSEINTILQSYGWIALFPIVLILDSLPQPISPDVVVMASAYFTDMNIISIIIVSGIGSLLAGILCYTIGWQYGMHFIKKRFSEKTIIKGEKMMQKYGAIGVLIGALTPLPYDIVCYLSGFFKVNIPLFVIISLVGRTLRFAVIAYVFRLLEM